IILALGGDWAKALVLAAWGGVVVAGIDNLLYPMLVGNRLKLHTVVAFIGAVGGIIFFGAPGLILGPATITVTLTLIEILNARFR
ncbi:AI-2E family transporter, partial [Corallococcus exiguus]|uniref:AI-2E family transporter n=1 Tax=Corallococcus exiguus TaxID=83462 RepID=UPI0014756DDB